MNLKLKILLIVFLIIIGSSYSFGQDTSKTNQKIGNKQENKQLSEKFVDADGDGYNDNAPDHDGDGIPNGIDADFIKLKKRKDSKALEYVDSDGDGINDNLQLRGKRKNRRGSFNKSNKNINPQNTSGNQTSGTGNAYQEKKGKGKGKG